MSNILSYIHECKGKQDLFVIQRPDVIKTLIKIAKINSTISSNSIENIHVSGKRVMNLMNEKSRPKNRNEAEVVGYKNVLNLIHSNFNFMEITPSVILQLHRDLFKEINQSENYGKWKSSDNTIIEIDELQNKKIRFQPTSAFETPYAIEKLCNEFNDALKMKHNIEPLFLIAEFVLVFLCIHPFNDGNGRMSRLLTLLLMYKTGYFVGKYISIEKAIEKTKENYYDALRDSSIGWNKHEYDSSYFINYFIYIVQNVYQQFVKRAIEVTNVKISKFDQVKKIFDDEIGKITKLRIKELLPNVSESMIEITLKKLLHHKYIEKIGDKKNTYYLKK